MGLESIDSHKSTLKNLSEEEYNFESRIKKSLSESKLLDPFIEIYERGDIEEIFAFGSYSDNGILAQRNKVMVNTSTEYINDGGLFMAVGAAHLAGEEGMISLLQEQGYTVEAVDVSFSKGLIHAEWAEQDLEWVTENYTDEGFSLMLPDNSFTYLPASMSGIVKVRSYPDLGTGHFYFYSVLPVLSDQYNLDSVRQEIKANITIQNGKITKEFMTTYDDFPAMELDYEVFGSVIKFRYVMANNYLYSQGITKLTSGEIDEKLSKKYFDSVDFFKIEKKATDSYRDEKGAYTLITDLPSQKFTEIDDSEGSVYTNEYTNFFDQENQLLHVVMYSHFEPGDVLSDIDVILDSYKDIFLSGSDSLVYDRPSSRFGGKEIYVRASDNSFLKATAFVRGNRLYQLFSAGPASDERLEIAEIFQNNFNLINYDAFAYEPFENDEFTCFFPSAPVIDTLEDFYYNTFGDEVLEETSYRSHDINTGINMWVSSHKLSPYTTYENEDSCETQLHELMTNYGDTLIHSSRNMSGAQPEFRFTTRGDNHQLNYQKRVILNGDKIYELTLVQDSSAISDEAIAKFLDGFEIKMPTADTKGQRLFRDSTLVKRELLHDIKSSDTLIAKQASNVLYRFSLSPEETEELNRFYSTVDLSSYPESYHSKMLYFFAAQEVENFETMVKSVYLDEGSSDVIKINILELLIGEETPSAIHLSKELLQHHIPRSEDSWDISYIFVYMENMELVKPLFPELIELGVQDSVVILNYLFGELLDKNIITYQTLEPIHSLLESKCETAYKQLQEAEDEEKDGIIDSNYATTILYSYSDENELAKSLFNIYFNKGSSFYSQLEGGKGLLRQGELPELSSLYDEHHESYYSLLEFYKLEQQFPQVQVLPDSMQTIPKYATTVALAYLEDIEYYDKITIKDNSSYEEDQLLHYFTYSESEYEYDEESYQVICYTVLPVKENGQLPARDEVFTDYFIQDEESETEIKEKLQASYETWQEQQ